MNINIRLNLVRQYITIINIYTPNDKPSKFLKQKLTELKGERDSSPVIVGDFNTPLMIIDKTTKQKINKEIKDVTQ